MQTVPELDRDTERTAMREAAAAALSAYDLVEPRVTLLDQKKNVTFRVETGSGSAPERFLLRLCNAGEYGREEILSEAVWLAHLRRKEGLLVPEPVPALDGSLVTGGSPRWCVLFRWVPGEVLQGVLTPERPADIERVGALLATLHRCSERFVPPPGFSRPRWDCDRLFGSREVVPPDLDEPLLPKRAREILDEAAAAVRETVRGLGEGPEVFGLIHKDLEPDNTVVWQGGLHAIDFADCGWGWYLYDMAASLLPLRERKGFPEMRDAFLRGYRGVRPVPPAHEDLLETFAIARSLFAVRLMARETLGIPRVREYAQAAIPHILGEIRRFLDRRVAAVRPALEPGRMTTVRFFAYLRERGIRLWAEGERLRFNAPQGALSPGLKAELANRKQEVLAFLRQGARAGGPVRMPAAVAASGRFPLSFAQHRLWLLQRLDPDSAVYNIARAVRLSGPVSAGLLERCLGEVVRRHAVLRTTFHEADGEPFQRLSPWTPWALPLVDLVGLPGEARQDEAQRLAAGLAHRPFDLERGPLLRLVLLRLGAEEHVAVAALHSIVGDHWSAGLLFREIGVLSEALATGRPSPLPEPPVQYADFAWWQRRHLQGEALDGHLSYWRRELDGLEPPRPAARGGRGERHASRIPREVAETLRELGRSEGAATLFMVLFAAFAAVLRAPGEDDLVVGSPVANRVWSQVEELIGPFVNPLALRVRMDGDPTFRELLGRVRQTVLGACAHQELPFEKLVEELWPERRTDPAPLFRVTFSLQNVPHPDSQVASFRMSLLPPVARTAQVDLSCDMKEMPEGVWISWRYRPERFGEAAVARLAERYAAVLEAVAADPGFRLSALSSATSQTATP